MKYTKLGNTGTTISRIALGCMSFGDYIPCGKGSGARGN